jgi:hypothetical protein
MALSVRLFMEILLGKLLERMDRYAEQWDNYPISGCPPTVRCKIIYAGSHCLVKQNQSLL